MDKDKKHRLFEMIGPEVKRTAVLLYDIIEEHGRIPKSEHTLQSLLDGNQEALRIIKNPEKMKEVLFVLQTATDSFMEHAENLMHDKRRTLQEKAKISLDIANAVLKAEKEVRIQELKNISDLMHNRGLAMDINI